MFSAVLKCELSSNFHYGFVDVDYDGGANTQRYLETEGVADDLDIYVGVYKGSDKDKPAFIGTSADKTKLVGFAVDYSTSTLKSFEISQTGTSIYPIFIIRTASEIEFSYVTG